MSLRHFRSPRTLIAAGLIVAGGAFLVACGVGQAPTAATSAPGEIDTAGGGSVGALANNTITDTSYEVHASGYVHVVSGAVNVQYSPMGTSRLGITVYVDAGFYFSPVTYSSTTVPPVMSDTVVATVNTSIGTLRRFNLSRGGKLEVTAVAPVPL